MADTPKTLYTRIFSALLAALVVFAACYFAGTRGAEAVCLVVIALGLREFSRMAFAKAPLRVMGFFLAACVLIFFALLAVGKGHTLAVFAAGMTLFYSGTLWLARGKMSNENLITALSVGTFGLIYCLLFPFYCLRLVQLEDGSQWFLFLLVVVFFGDTFAYFGGSWFGRAKLMPDVSPNKTWEGALCGLAGSALGGTLHASSVFQEVSRWQIFVFCVVCGMVAQSGDLLVSLLKRVSHVKDAGHIMPGHGGILDRLDGLYIACPLVYLFALYVRPGSG